MHSLRPIRRRGRRSSRRPLIAADPGELPGPDAFDSGDSRPLPRPFWRSESNARIRLCGDPGQLLYENIDTYHLVGADTVLWFDVADCSPTITVKRPVEQAEGSSPPSAVPDP
jgi:hypothetical protein